MYPRTAFESFSPNGIKLAKPVIKLKGGHVAGTSLAIFSEDAPDQAVDGHAKNSKSLSHTWLGPWNLDHSQ
jgi:hypothetical protein